MTTRVTGPESITPEAPSENMHYHDTGGSLINIIGPNQLDGPRIATREAVYGNSQQEREMVTAIDEAAFDRVRALEQTWIGNARTFIEGVTQKGDPDVYAEGGPRRGVIDSAEAIVTKLNDLVTELERGVPASQLAERFKKLQGQALHSALPKVVNAMAAIESSYLPNMEAPYERVQATIAKMPYSSYRPLDPQRYIRR